MAQDKDNAQAPEEQMEATQNEQQDTTQEHESAELKQGEAGQVDAGAEEQADEDAAQEKIAQLEDQLLRTQAEMQNVRRRSDQEVEKARKFALERFAKELLPVADNLQRSIDAAGDAEEVAPLLEGVQLTLKSLNDVFERFNVERIDPQGEPFDPQLHEAISMVSAPDAEPNSVIDVVQAGYRLNGRVIRAAMVVVAQG